MQDVPPVEWHTYRKILRRTDIYRLRIPQITLSSPFPAKFRKHREKSVNKRASDVRDLDNFSGARKFFHCQCRQLSSAKTEADFCAGRRTQFARAKNFEDRTDHRYQHKNVQLSRSVLVRRIQMSNSRCGYYV
jgi:hypothetical protein